MAFRTDRHNNPTAMTTDVAKTGKLAYGVDYVTGDPFPNNPNLRTARLLGDPIDTTIKAIDNMGFYTQSGQPRWTYIAMPQSEWLAKSYDEKKKIVLGMYKVEGGSGQLGTGGALPNMGKKSYEEFAAAIKAQYPQYQGVDDLELAKMVVEKYPSYATKVAFPGEEPVNTNFAQEMGGGFVTTPAPVAAGSAAAAGTVGLPPNAGTEIGELGGTLNEKIGGGLHRINEEIKNPSVGVRAALKFPGELVNEVKKLPQTLVEPQLKGIASGTRAIQATPEVAKATGGLLKDLFQGNLVNEKGEKVGWTHAIKNPTKTFVPSAAPHVKKADETMKKSVKVGPIEQKTMAGSSNLENFQTASTAALQALGVKAPAATSGVLKGALSKGTGLVSKAAGLAKGSAGALKYPVIGGAISGGHWLLNKIFGK